MARVTYGVGVTEFKGSIGGVTFQRNTSGTIVKHKTYHPVNPSVSQSVNQANLARMVSLWPTLTLSQMADWNALAAAHDHTNLWGETKTISGYQWFLANNLNLLATGQAVNLICQPFVSPAAPDQFTLEADALGLYLRWSPAYTPAYNYSLIMVSPPLRQGNILLKRSLFTLASFGSGAQTEINIKADYEAAFNITWSQFFANSVSFIIARNRCIMEDDGYSSVYTSDIVKIN